MFRFTLAALFTLSLTACYESEVSDDDDDGGSEDGGTDNTGGTGGGEASFNEGIPCGQILDCTALCEDNDCMQACYDDAYPTGQQLMDELESCFTSNGCSDWACLETHCSSELGECEEDIPSGGNVCLAEGIYQLCDESGFCWEEKAVGGGWGASQEAAMFWSAYDCSEFMLSIISINSITGSGSVVTSCEAVACESN